MSDTNAAADEMLTTKEIAKKLKVCRNTVYNLIKRGCFEAHKVGPRSIRVPVASFEKYYAATRSQPQSE